MLLKIVVALILLFSSSAVGYLISLRYSLRVKQLKYFQSSINSLETEIIYYATALPKAMERIAKRSHKSIGNIFDETHRLLSSKDGYRIDEAWRLAISKYKDQTSLSKEDIEIIVDFGKDLGVGNKEIQKNHFQFLKNLLEDQRKKAILENDKNGKMYNRLGVILGLAIVIILI